MLLMLLPLHAPGKGRRLGSHHQRPIIDDAPWSPITIQGRLIGQSISMYKAWSRGQLVS